MLVNLFQTVHELPSNLHKKNVIKECLQVIGSNAAFFKELVSSGLSEGIDVLFEKSAKLFVQMMLFES